MQFKKYIWPLQYSVFLTVFTIYVLLDTFVIACVYTTDPEDNRLVSIDQSQSVQQNNEHAGSTEPIITDCSYKDGSISITIDCYREYNSDIYVADVRLNSASYLQTALAQGAYRRKVE